MPRKFDEKCLDLARHFYAGPMPKLEELAQEIQETVEAWLTEEGEDVP